MRKCSISHYFLVYKRQHFICLLSIDFEYYKLNTSLLLCSCMCANVDGTFQCSKEFFRIDYVTMLYIVKCTMTVAVQHSMKKMYVCLCDCDIQQYLRYSIKYKHRFQLCVFFADRKQYGGKSNLYIDRVSNITLYYMC